MAKSKIETRGRKPSLNPKATLITFRVDEELEKALLAYRDKLDFTGLSVSAVARDLIVKALKREGFLK